MLLPRNLGVHRDRRRHDPRPHVVRVPGPVHPRRHQRRSARAGPCVSIGVHGWRGRWLVNGAHRPIARDHVRAPGVGPRARLPGAAPRAAGQRRRRCRAATRPPNLTHASLHVRSKSVIPRSHRGSVRRQGRDRHRRRARHRPQPRAAPRVGGRGGRGERPRRLERRRRRRRHPRAAGRRRDRGQGRPRDRQLRQRVVVDRRGGDGRSRRSTSSAASTCSSTTPASCATR